MFDSADEVNKIQKVVVLGGGSAGLLVALSLATRLPRLKVVVVRSTKLGVIGVGEGTIAAVVRFLHQYLKVDPQRFHREVEASIKLGVKFLWGPRPFFYYTFTEQFSGRTPPRFQLSMPRGYYCQDDVTYADGTSALMYHEKVAFRGPNGEARLNGPFAYHLENENFVEFMEKVTDESGVTKIDAIVSGVEIDQRGVSKLVLDSGEEITGDLFVDCSGFRSALLGNALEEPFVDFSDALFCDRAVAGGWERTDETYSPYTTAETMNSGWAWQIEHDHLINRGYVYSSRFIPDEEAEKEFREKNPKIDDTRMLKFKCGVHRRAWVKNVVAIGNAYGFVEPLEATAISMICGACGHLVKMLDSADGIVEDPQRDVFNRLQDKNWQIIRDFLALHYKFNNRLDTPFWRACQNDVQLGETQSIVDFYKVVGPDFSALAIDMKRDIFGADGYISMLLGQGVKFRRNVAVSPGELQKWDRLKHELHLAAERGFEMSEYLTAVREGQVDFSNALAAGTSAGQVLDPVQ